jgi:hypothetical protein
MASTPAALANSSGRSEDLSLALLDVLAAAGFVRGDANGHATVP